MSYFIIATSILAVLWCIYFITAVTYITVKTNYGPGDVGFPGWLITALAVTHLMAVTYVYF